MQPGWHVLDAGCGGGAFLPLLCELVGPNGRVTAMDLAPENIARVDSLAAAKPTMPLTTKVGSLVDLPFPDNTFDGLWTANVVQYLTEPELDRAFAEFYRVLKPGGKLAVKEFDSTLFGLFPLDHAFHARFQAAREALYVTRGIFGVFNSQTIPGRIRAAGLTAVQGKSWLIERRAPLSPPSRAFWNGALKYWASDAFELVWADEDRMRLRALAADVDRVIENPDFCVREGFIVAVGTKPTTG